MHDATMVHGETTQANTDRLRALRRPHDYDFAKQHLSKKEVMERAKKEGVQFINLQFCDFWGILKAVTIPIHKLEEALDHNIWFDGSSIEGFTRIFESDMFLKPDMNTFAVLPWTKGMGDVTARMICDVYLSNGEPFEGDPRFILKQQLKKAEKLGYSFNTGPELEFFLFRKENGKLMPLPHDQAGYFDQTMDLAMDIRKDMSFALDHMGVEVEALHHEVAVGQHEIDFKYSSALQTADNTMTLKMVLKAVANLHGLHATFMPKPIGGINGSGMHVHQSLFKGDKNIFFDEKDEYHLSEIAKSYIAGQLKHIRSMNAILNPIVNSYKRLVVGYEAPVYIAWAARNRSALIRIPRATEGNHNATRCELRCPDPSCNPYLAFAVMLAAGLDGIEKKMTPPGPVEENIYHLSDKDIVKKSIGSVCGDLPTALKEMGKSSLMRSVLGEHVFKTIYEAGMQAWDEYRMSISQYELDRYLEVY